MKTNKKKQLKGGEGAINCEIKRWKKEMKRLGLEEGDDDDKEKSDGDGDGGWSWGDKMGGTTRQQSR